MIAFASKIRELESDNPVSAFSANFLYKELKEIYGNGIRISKNPKDEHYILGIRDSLNQDIKNYIYNKKAREYEEWAND